MRIIAPLFWIISAICYHFYIHLTTCPSFCIPVEPINFLFPLEDQTVKQLPGIAYFQTEITLPNLKATWYKGDTVISQSKKYEMTSQMGIHKLTINDVTGEDECDYSAEFRDVKTTAKLHVCGE